MTNELQMLSNVKKYSGNVINLEKSKEMPILMRPITEAAYDKAAVTVKETFIEDYICRQDPIKTLYPLYADYKEDHWEAKAHGNQPVTTIPINGISAEVDMLEEAGVFCETPEGLFAIKDLEVLYCITNTRLRIKTHIKRYVDEDTEPTEYLECLLYFKNWEVPKTIVILSSEFKSAYNSVFRDKFPEICLSSKGRDHLDKYLSMVYSHCQRSWREESRIQFTGWTKIGGSIRYVIGDDAAYKGYHFPDVSGMDKNNVFTDGFSFLDIGNYQSTVVIPFIFAHFAYLQFFAQQAYHDFESLLFIKGERSSKKTAIAAVFCNIFDVNRKKKLTFGTTKAALYTTLSKLQDQTNLLDDYSCSEKQKKQADTQLFEVAIRAIGDSASPSKMSGSKGGDVDYRKFRSALVVTGEDSPALSSSSQFRMVTVSVDVNSYDGTALGKFQKKPAIMSNYMALFIEYLRNHESETIAFFQNEFDNYRIQYTPYFKVERVRDAAINFIMVSKIICNFANWCGVVDRDIYTHIENFNKAILGAMLDVQEENKSLEPEVMFIYGLMQVLETREKIKLAETELQYIKTESAFIGFKEIESDTIWLRHEDAEQAVRCYWEKIDKAYTISSDKLLQLLCQREISIGTELRSGKRENLKKAKKGQRKRMLVLKNSKVQEVLQLIEE